MKNYKSWILTKPCSVPGCLNEDIHPHHWQTPDNHGVGKKPDDTWLIPLCTYHHTAGPESIHKGKVTFARLWWRLSKDYKGPDAKYQADSHAIRLIRDLLGEYLEEMCGN
jgi:hypothetical protein